jgi:hypothetical protein
MGRAADLLEGATDRTRQAPWRPFHAAEPASCRPARVLAVEDRCWCCRSRIRGIVGVVLRTPGGAEFVPLVDIGEELVASLDRRVLAARGIGALRHRASPGVGRGSVTNSCVHCDALIGHLRLEDLLADHRAAGGRLHQLDIGIRVDMRPRPHVRAPAEPEAL